MLVNGIDNGQIQVVTPDELDTSPSDMLIANILAGPLIDLASRFADLVRPRGHILLSGILDTQLQDILLAYKPYFELNPAITRDEWGLCQWYTALMFNSTHLGKVMETTCNQCRSRFRLTEKQLRQAYGKVVVWPSVDVFSTQLNSLKSYEGELPDDYYEQLEVSESAEENEPELAKDFAEQRRVSLHEAMYGSERRPFFSFGPLAWFVGILLLAAIGTAQVILLPTLPAG